MANTQVPLNEHEISASEYLFDWMEDVLESVVMKGAGPTRGGNYVQVRVSFNQSKHPKKHIRCFTTSVEEARTYSEHTPLGFHKFCYDTFNIHQHARKLPNIGWTESNRVVNQVTTDLVHAGWGPKTASLRIEMVRALREVAISDRIPKQKNKAEVRRAITKMRKWMEHGFLHGMEKSDIDTLVEETLVRHIIGV